MLLRLNYICQTCKDASPHAANALFVVPCILAARSRLIPMGFIWCESDLRDERCTLGFVLKEAGGVSLFRFRCVWRLTPCVMLFRFHFCSRRGLLTLVRNSRWGDRMLQKGTIIFSTLFSGGVRRSPLLFDAFLFCWDKSPGKSPHRAKIN